MQTGRSKKNWNLRWYLSWISKKKILHDKMHSKSTAWYSLTAKVRYSSLTTALVVMLKMLLLITQNVLHILKPYSSAYILITLLNLFNFYLRADCLTFQKLGLNSDLDPYTHDHCASDVKKSRQKTAQENYQNPQDPFAFI